jgi:succinoglycan biosynthesis transport protein ExoP
METRYFIIIRRWLWLLVLASLTAGAAAYFLLKDAPPSYEAKARLLVGPGIDSPDPDMNALRAGGQLMQTYAELADTGPFLQTIIEELNLNTTPELLSKRIEVKTNQETQILTISAQHNRPNQSIAIANATAEQLVRLSPSGSDSPTALLKEQMRNQVQKLEEIIANSEGTIEKLESDLTALAGDEQQGLIVLQTNDYLEKQRLIIEQISQERGRLSDALNALALLYDSLKTTPTNQVQIVEPASSAAIAVSQLRITILIAGLAGFVFALVVVFAIEYFDDTIKTVEEFTNITGLSVLGTIPKSRKLEGEGIERLVIRSQPRSKASEGYRILGTKLLTRLKVHRNRDDDDKSELRNLKELHPGEYGKLRSIIISGSDGDVDSSEVATNVAIVLAQMGNKVVLVDANLQRPMVSQNFGAMNKYGLFDALRDENRLPEYIQVDWLPGLSIVPSGSPTTNSFELLASSRMPELVAAFEDKAEIVIITASPLLSFADSLMLASRVDGLVIVARSFETKRTSLVELVESLNTFDVNLIGVVVDENRSKDLSFAPESQDRTLVDTTLSWVSKPFKSLFSDNGLLKRDSSLATPGSHPGKTGVPSERVETIKLNNGNPLGIEVFPINSSKI